MLCASEAIALFIVGLVFNHTSPNWATKNYAEAKWQRQSAQKVLHKISGHQSISGLASEVAVRAWSEDKPKNGRVDTVMLEVLILCVLKAGLAYDNRGYFDPNLLIGDNLPGKSGEFVGFKDKSILYHYFDCLGKVVGVDLEAPTFLTDK